MRLIGLAQAKAQLSALLDAVASGDEVVITRRGKPVARLVREGSTSQAVSQANWMQRFRSLHISESVSEPSAVERVRELRDV